MSSNYTLHGHLTYNKTGILSAAVVKGDQFMTLNSDSFLRRNNY